jgi:methyl-accepting chemotaxis protein
MASQPRAKVSIGTKLLLFTLFFTIIPLLITAALIIYTYQDLIRVLLTEGGVQVSEEVMLGLSTALDNARIQATLTVFIVIILTLFGNILTSRGFTRPLQRLIRGIQEISKGNLDFKVQTGSQDEWGDLASHFNNMTHELKATQKALEEAKKDLERKVKERTVELDKTMTSLEEAKTTLEIKVQARTKELEELNKNLDGQIKQRTKELEDKVKELERFREIAVGREMKMVELKKELDKLKDKKG